MSSPMTALADALRSGTAKAFEIARDLTGDNATVLRRLIELHMCFLLVQFREVPGLTRSFGRVRATNCHSRAASPSLRTTATIIRTPIATYCQLVE